MLRTRPMSWIRIVCVVVAPVKTGRSITSVLLQLSQNDFSKHDLPHRRHVNDTFTLLSSTGPCLATVPAMEISLFACKVEGNTWRSNDRGTNTRRFRSNWVYKHAFSTSLWTNSGYVWQMSIRFTSSEEKTLRGISIIRVTCQMWNHLAVYSRKHSTTMLLLG